MQRRATDDDSDVTTHAIKEQRRDMFDWIGLAITGAPLLLKVVLALGLGGAAVVGGEKVYQRFSGEPLPIAEGETVIPSDISPELRQSLDSLNAAINKHTEALEQLRRQRQAGDSKLEERVEFLEGQH